MRKFITKITADKALWEIIALGTAWVVFFAIMGLGLWLLAIINGTV